MLAIFPKERRENSNLDKTYEIIFYLSISFILVIFSAFQYSSEEHSKQVKKSSRRISTFKVLSFFLSILHFIFLLVVIFKNINHVSWLGHCLLELQG